LLKNTQCQIDKINTLKANNITLNSKDGLFSLKDIITKDSLKEAIVYEIKTIIDDLKVDEKKKHGLIPELYFYNYLSDNELIYKARDCNYKEVKELAHSYSKLDEVEELNLSVCPNNDQLTTILLSNLYKFNSLNSKI
jgi:hypothetical protein